MRSGTGLAILFLAVCAMGARQPFGADDLWLWRTASDARISPDGSRVVYVEAWNDRGANAAYANLWVASSNGRDRTPFTQGAWRDSSPRWSPDGSRIAYLSDRTGSAQIYVRDTQITNLQTAPLRIAWSPDGRAIVFTCRAAPKALAWAPPAILPFLQPPSDGAEQTFTVPAAGGTVGPAPAFDAAALPSPDGGKIAWTADGRLYVKNADGSRVKLLAGSLDRDVVDPRWSSDSRTIYFLADDRGSTHVYAAHNDGTVRQVTKAKERLTGFSLADNGRATTVRSSATEGGNVIAFAVDLPGGVTTLAEPNGYLLAERNIGDVEEIHYDSGGRAIQAWVVKPPGFDAARKYPLLLAIHDDPRAMYGAEFQLAAQIYAASGYVVLCANPRGSPGYGGEFGTLLPTRYPGDDADDLMRGVDFVISKGYVDPKRLFVSGGLVAAWLIGHTDRFAAAILRHPVADWLTDVATRSDGLHRAAAWMGAMPWADPDQYVKHSPVYFAANFKTPSLVIASAQDPESDEMYFALQATKVDSALVRLGDDRPGTRVLEMNAALAWLKRY